jgi:hypothetical protein
VKIFVTSILFLFVLAGTGSSSIAQTQSLSFTNALNLSNTRSDSQSPELISSHDGLFAVWVETDSGRSNIFFSKSTNDGVTFDTPLNLSGSSQGQSSSPAIVTNGKNVYVIWQSSTSGNSTILFTKSSDGGTSFEKPGRLSEISKNSAFPQIALSENHIYSSWVEKLNNSTNIKLAKSDDGGNSFQNPISITDITGNVGIPKLSAYGNEVNLIWEDNSKGNFEIFLSKSTDYGTSFDKPSDVSNTIGQSGAPQLAASENNLYAIWMDNTSGNYDILFSRSTDSGKSFGKPLNLSNLHGDSGYPTISVSGKLVYVTWTQTISNTNYDIFFTKSSDGGETFDKPINLSNNPGASGWPQIVSNGNNVYVNWVDNSPGKFDVFITKSADGGISFEKPINISNTKNDSYVNKLVALDNTVYNVWQEGQMGNHTILFSKSVGQSSQISSQQVTPTANDTGLPPASSQVNPSISVIIVGAVAAGIVAIIIFFVKRKSRPKK